MSPDIRTWRVVAPGKRDREVTPPPLPNFIVHDTSMVMSTRVGVNSVPIYLLESEVLQGWDGSWQISILPLRVL